jgi:cytochrome c oxidase subunit III
MSPHLAHHFDTPQQQFASGKLGMWLFLAQEVLFFGGVFVAYAVYRANHPEVFIHASQYLDKTLGGINTVVLISSSFSMALAVRFSQLGQRKALMAALVVTIVCAFGFMGIKAVEYEAKWKHGLLWGQHYDPHHEEHGDHGEGHEELGGTGNSLPVERESEDRSNIAPSATGPAGLASADHPVEGVSHVGEGEQHNVQVFFGIYFAMTGLHGLHVLIGIGLMFWLLFRARRGDFGPRYFIPVDAVGLYWHLVDLIWIFLFPLLYLIG